MVLLMTNCQIQIIHTLPIQEHISMKRVIISHKKSPNKSTHQWKKKTEMKIKSLRPKGVAIKSPNDRHSFSICSRP